MENNQTIAVKKMIIVVVSFIVFIILIHWAWDYFHTGRIIITTNSSQNSIALTTVNSNNVGGATQKTFKAKGQLSVKVSLGSYVVDVSNGQKVATQLITLGSSKTLRYDIALSNMLETEPVINTPAQDIALSNSDLVYLNTSTNNINSIDINNNISTIGPHYQFQTIKWANVNFGVGQVGQQNLYLINNGLVRPLTLPALSSNKAIEYDVASNEQIYLSSGSNVYMGTAEGNYKKLYTAPAPPTVVGGSNNKVAVVYSMSGGNNDGYDSSGVTIATVNTSGQVAKTHPGQDVSSLIWSPNDNYLASLNESSINIYSATLHSVAIIPTTFPAGYLSWLSDDKIVYADSEKLWTYDLSTGRADLIANMPLDSTVTGLAVSEDGSYIYISTGNTINSSNSAILRVSLTGLQAPTIVDELQVLLPMSLNGYNISLVNFAQPPTVLVTPSRPGNVNQNSYIQQAQSALQQDGFDTSQLRFSLSQSN